MVASKQVEIPFHRSVCRKRGRGFGTLAQIIGRTAMPFLRKCIVPAAKCVSADLLEIAAEIADVEKFPRIFQTAAKSVWRQILRVRLGSVTRIGVQAKSFRKNLQNKPVGREEPFLQTFLNNHASIFRYPPSVSISANVGRKVPVVDNNLASP